MNEKFFQTSFKYLCNRNMILHIYYKLWRYNHYILKLLNLWKQRHQEFSSLLSLRRKRTYVFSLSSANLLYFEFILHKYDLIASSYVLHSCNGTALSTSVKLRCDTQQNKHTNRYISSIYWVQEVHAYSTLLTGMMYFQ